MIEQLKKENLALQERLRMLEKFTGHDSPGEEKVALPYHGQVFLNGKILDSLPYRIFVKNRELKYIACNTAFASDLGLTPGQVIGKSDYDLYPKETADNHIAVDKSVMMSGGNKDFTEAIWVNNIQKWFRTVKAPLCNNAGQSVGVVGIFEEITSNMDAREQLRKSEELLAVTLQSIGDGVITTDTQGNVVSMNQVAERLCGWTLNDAAGKPLKEVFHIVNAFTRAPVENPAEQALKSGKIVGLANHTMLLSRDGSEHQIFDSAAPIKNSSGQILGVVLVFMDVTEKYAKEQALRESEERLRHIVEHSTNTFYSHDVDGNLIYLSPQIKELLGYEVSEAMGDWTRMMSDNPINQAGLAYTQYAIDTGQTPPPYELELVHKKGHRVWVEIREAPLIENGKVVAIVGSHTDITERKKAETVLREREELLSVTLKSIGDGMIATDSRGRVENMNPVAEKMCGYTLDEARGKRITDIFHIIHETTREPAPNPVLTVLETGNVVGRANHTSLISKSGQEYHITDSAAPIKSADGKLLGVIMVFSDVTEKAQKTKALAQSEEKLRHIIENSTNVFFSHDVNGDLIYLSPQIKDLLGFEIHEAMGDRTKMLSDNPINETGKQYTQKAIETGQAQPPFELELVHKNGHKVWVEIREAPVVENGKVVAIVGSNTDITERKKAEKALREREELLSVTLKSIGDGMIVTDSRGRVENMNPVAEKMCGYTLDEARGKKITDIFNIIHETTREQAQNPVLTVLETGKIVGLANHTSLISKSGREYHITDSAAPIKSADGKLLGVIMVFSDVTEKYLKAKALAQSEEKLRHIIENSTNVFFSHDVNGDLIYVSPQIKDLLGYEVHEAIFKWTNLLSDNPINETGKEYTQKAIETGQAQPTYELELVHKNGHKVWVEIREAPVVENGKVVAIVGSNTDITERKKAETALREREELLSVTLKSIGDGMIVTDSRGRVENMNPVAEKMCGYTLDEARGKKITDIFNIIHETTRKPAQNPVLTVLKTGKIVGLANHTSLISKSGREYHITDSAAPIKTADGKLLGVIMVFSDVTEKYQKAKALAKSEEKLRNIIENSTNVFFSHDIYGEHIYLSTQIKDLLGFEVDEAMGNWTKLLSDNPINEIGKALTQKAIETGQAQPPYELEFVHKNGHKVWVEIREAPVVEDGKVVAIAGSYNDITERRLAEINLKESEAKFRNLFDSSLDAILLMDGPTIIQCNLAALKVFGCSYDDILGETICKFCPEEQPFGENSKTVAYEIIEAANLGIAQYFEWLHTRKDGTTFFAEVSLNRVEIQGKYFLQAIVRDITAKKLAEKQLKESEEKFRTILENMGEGLLLTDLEDRILYTNPRIKEIYGYDPEVLIGKIGYKALEHPDDWVNFHQKSQLRQQGVSDSFEVRGIKNTGEIIWTRINGAPIKDASGNIIGTVGIITDITQQRQAHLNLKMLWSAIEQSPASVVITDPDGKIEYVNQGFVEVTGYTLDEVIGQNPNILKSGLHSQEYYQQLWETIKGGKTWQGELQNKRKDGSLFFEKAVISPVLNSEGETVHYIGIKEDVTEVRTTEAERYKRLERRQKEAEVISIVASSSYLIEGEVNALADLISEKASEVLQVDTMGVWLFDEKQENLVNIATFSPVMGKLEPGFTLSEQACHREFNILRKTRYVDASDAQNDSRVAAFLENYLRPNQVTSTLDVAIIVDGIMVGVLCCEYRNRLHTWLPEEITFAKQLADQMALAIMHREKKKADDQIRILSMAIEQSPISIVISNTVGIVEYVNPRFCEQTGYSATETIGKHLSQLHPDSSHPELFPDLWESVSSGKMWANELLLTRKNGELYWERFLVSPIFEGEGSISHYVDFRIDITRRKSAEKELRERERMFSTLVSNLPGMIYRTMMDRNWTVLFLSKACYPITGYQPEYFINNQTVAFNDIILSQYQNILWEKWQEVVAENKVFEHEYQIRRADGEIRWVWERGQPVYDEAGKVKYLEGYMEDVTERKLAEEEIIKNRDRLLEFFEEDITADYISTPEGKLLVCNDTFLRVFDFESKEEAYNYPVKYLYHTESDRIHFLNRVNEHGKIENFEVKYVTNKKRIIHALINAKGEFDSDGNLVQIRGYINDITMQKKMFDELIEAKEKAEESNRLKSAFLANMSHEIRTPMNGIMGFTDLLKEPDLTGHERDSFISIIHKSGQRLLKTVDDLINLSKIEAGLVDFKTNNTNLNQLGNEVFDFFLIEANRKNLKLAFKPELQNEKAFIVTDGEKLHAVLTNLVNNAIKYTHKGFVEFGYTTVPGHVHYYVSDSGIGIPQERQNAVFERFVQADLENRHAYQGAGLGLAIVKSYIEMMGGTIWVESTPNVGSTFHFTLPFHQGTKDVETPVSTEPSNFDLENKKVKILVAEDDNISVSLLKRTLNPIAREILYATNGKETIEIIQQHPDIELILMDISMPEINGYEATKQIRAFNTEVCIIAQTAFAMFGDREKALEAGCDDYISKPVKLDALKKLLKKHLGSEKK